MPARKWHTGKIRRLRHGEWVVMRQDGRWTILRDQFQAKFLCYDHGGYLLSKRGALHPWYQGSQIRLRGAREGSWVLALCGAVEVRAETTAITWQAPASRRALERAELVRLRERLAQLEGTPLGDSPSDDIDRAISWVEQALEAIPSCLRGLHDDGASLLQELRARRAEHDHQDDPEPQCPTS